MTLPTEVNPLLIGNQGYRISRSVRFRAAATAFFNRTPAVAGNRRTWTWSGWVKRGALGSATTFGLMEGNASATTLTAVRISADGLSVQDYSGTGIYNLIWSTSAVFRDPSAWYHIVYAYDTTQASSAAAVKIYVNGVEQALNFSALSGSYVQNRDSFINATNAQRIGVYNGLANFLDGYLTEINFIDGQALTPSSFGEINPATGVWQPKRYTGTYGTNGFYLNFSDNSAATAAAIGKDYSGNGNNWTPNNISLTAGATYDSMIDVPTQWEDGSTGRSNYPTLQPTAGLGNGTYSDANLGFVSGVLNTWRTAPASLFQSSGKFYFEATVVGLTSANFVMVGVIAMQTLNAVYPTYVGGVNNGWGIQGNTVAGSVPKYTNATLTTVTNASFAVTAVGNVYQVAVNADTGQVWFGRNNIWLEGDPAAGTTPSYTVSPVQLLAPAISCYSNAGDKLALNCGQRPFAYTPPTGFKALNALNIPAPTVLRGNQFFDATTYTGTGANQNIVNSGPMQPDFVWIKSRSAATDNILINSAVGGSTWLISNSTNAEATNAAAAIQSFNSNGFTIGNGGAVNTNLATYVAWQWNAGGNTVTNTAGTITSQVRASATAGVSIVLFDLLATGSQTVGHGLGVAPRLIIVKARTSGGTQPKNWFVYHAALGATGFLLLNTTDAFSTNSTVWDNTNPTASVFTMGSGFTSGNYGTSQIAFCFSEIPGFSRIRGFSGNGLADGPFVYCGFRPRYILLKSNSAGAGLDWTIWDTARNTYNVGAGGELYADLSSAEVPPGQAIDVLSNGFKIRSTGTRINPSGGLLVFAAFAENPFKYSLAR